MYGKAKPIIRDKAPVYCPICTHIVNTLVIVESKRTYVKPGQRCSHCGSTLDAGCVLDVDRAA